jgi:glycosyltransferase involved in cell wall biosynthesis
MAVNASVVICAHTMDRWADLQDAVRSVRDQSHPPHEVLVVVDHNPTLLARARAQGLEATIVDNDETRGLGGARNAGLKRATGEVVAFLDDDAIAPRDWLGLLLDPYREADVIAVGGAIEPLWEGERPGWFPPEFDWTIGCTYRGLPTRPQAVRNVFGCNMSFRREALEAAGRFRLGYGCDETEICIRIAKLWPGTRILYRPDASVLHRVPAERKDVRRFLSRCYFEGGSKAVVARLQGSQQGLSSEREYTRRVLPAGVREGLADGVTGRDGSGLLRAAAIVAGLIATTLGYIAGSVTFKKAARRRGWTGDALGVRAAAGAR